MNNTMAERIPLASIFAAASDQWTVIPRAEDYWCAVRHDHYRIDIEANAAPVATPGYVRMRMYYDSRTSFENMLMLSASSETVADAVLLVACLLGVTVPGWSIDTDNGVTWALTEVCAAHDAHTIPVADVDSEVKLSITTNSRLSDHAALTIARWHRSSAKHGRVMHRVSRREPVDRTALVEAALEIAQWHVDAGLTPAGTLERDALLALATWGATR